MVKDQQRDPRDADRSTHAQCRWDEKATWRCSSRNQLHFRYFATELLYGVRVRKMESPARISTRTCLWHPSRLSAASAVAERHRPALRRPCGRILSLILRPAPRVSDFALCCRRVGACTLLVALIMTACCKCCGGASSSRAQPTLRPRPDADFAPCTASV